MKGGSTTLALLVAVCCTAVDSYLHPTPQISDAVLSQERLVQSSMFYSQETIARAYRASIDSLPPVMSSAAASLTPRDGIRGRIYHVGCGLAGAMACIDTSEMPDTYGSPFEETRAFIDGGWCGLGVVSGDISHISSMHRIGLSHFRTDIAPMLTPRDTVIFNVISDNMIEPSHGVSTDLLAIADAVCNSGASGHVIHVVLLNRDQENNMTTSGNAPQEILSHLPSSAAIYTTLLPMHSAGRATRAKNSGALLYASLALKVMLNAVSTYAQGVGRGAIFKVI